MFREARWAPPQRRLSPESRTRGNDLSEVAKVSGLPERHVSFTRSCILRSLCRRRPHVVQPLLETLLHCKRWRGRPKSEGFSVFRLPQLPQARWPGARKSRVRDSLGRSFWQRTPAETPRRWHAPSFTCHFMLQCCQSCEVKELYTTRMGLNLCIAIGQRGAQGVTWHKALPMREARCSSASSGISLLHFTLSRTVIEGFQIHFAEACVGSRCWEGRRG